MVVVCYVDHVICIYGAERSEAVSDNGEEGNEDTVDDVNNINLLSPDIDPTDQKQHPREPEQGYESGIESDEETKCCCVLADIR